MTELAGGLPARACAGCGAVLIELDDYQRWLGRTPLLEAVQHAAVVPAENDPPLQDHAGARRCPACARLMQRLRVGVEADFRIDRCAPCGLLWLDRGEWAALRAAGLAHQLVERLNDSGQRDIQQSELRRRREATLRQRHGDACIDELSRVRQWLMQQPHRDELLALLRAGW